MPEVTQQSISELKLAVCDMDDSAIAFVRRLFSRLGDKWSFRTLDALAAEPLRFTTLTNALPGISHRVLTVTLRALQDDGMVSRTSYPESPARVEYALTPLGDGFLRQALTMVTWSQDHRLEVERSQALSQQ